MKNLPPVMPDKEFVKNAVNYPAHRAGHLKKLDEGIASPSPRSAFIPVHRTGYSAEGFHKVDIGKQGRRSWPATA